MVASRRAWLAEGIVTGAGHAACRLLLPYGERLGARTAAQGANKTLVHIRVRRGLIRLAIFLGLVASTPLLAACQSDTVIVADLLAEAGRLNGTDVNVDGAYLGRAGDPAVSVLALGISTQDNGLDARPLGDPIWLEGFPEAQLRERLHQPGDAVYGFVRVKGRFETGGSYGPNSAYKHRIVVASAEPIEQVRRTEVRVPDAAPAEGQLAFRALAGDPAKYNGQQITTTGYYFWNGAIFVLAEGVSAEEDGSNPQPIGKQIWMEGFPAEESGKLTVGPGSPPAFVWGLVEVTGPFQSGGAFGKDGAYSEFLQVTSAKALAKR